MSFMMMLVAVTMVPNESQSNMMMSSTKHSVNRECVLVLGDEVGHALNWDEVFQMLNHDQVGQPV